MRGKSIHRWIFFVVPNNFSISFPDEIPTSHVLLAQQPAVQDAPTLLNDALVGHLMVYVVLIVAASLLGGWLPDIIRLGHRRLQMMISVVGSLMLGIGLLHQLPHSVVAASAGGKGVDYCVLWMLAGILLTFFLLRWFHFHSHDDSLIVETIPQSDDDESAHDQSHEHDHRHSHGHHHAHGYGHARTGAKSGWMGIFIGMSIHSLLDGVALAAHVSGDYTHAIDYNFTPWLSGLGTFLGVLLHKPLDSLSITALMMARGWSPAWRWSVNIAYSLACPLGTVLFLFGAEFFTQQYYLFIAASLALSAGVFVCIALSDLLPEIEMHSHDRELYTILMAVGILLAWGIGFLEPEHNHNLAPVNQSDAPALNPIDGS